MAGEAPPRLPEAEHELVAVLDRGMAAEPEPESERESEPVSPEGGVPQSVKLSQWSRVLLAAAAVLIALVTAAQFASMMLAASPPNTLSQKYNAQLNWWVTPWLGQNWKLFGPDPQVENLTILVRVQDASGAQSAWVNLTAIDYAAVLHDPMPSHANENELRLAWAAYADSEPGSATQNLLRQYLVNFAAERLGITGPGSYTAVQFESLTTPMPPPGTSAPQPPTNQYLPWWPLTTQNGSI